LLSSQFLDRFGWVVTKVIPSSKIAKILSDRTQIAIACADRLILFAAKMIPKIANIASGHTLRIKRLLIGMDEPTSKLANVGDHRPQSVLRKIMSFNKIAKKRRLIGQTGNVLKNIIGWVFHSLSPQIRQ
jgi:hypothetical protein